MMKTCRTTLFSVTEPAPIRKAPATEAAIM
jgi:hypothetical protein